MKLFLPFMAFLFYSCSTNKSIPASLINLKKIEGRLTYTLPYCNGVAPSPEEIEILNTPIPYLTKLYLKQGTSNTETNPIIDSVVTDSSGAYTFEELPGDYVILLPSQVNRQSINTYLGMEKKFLAVDSLCLEKWWEKGLFQISVKDKDIANLNFNFYNKCFVPQFMPCAVYTGPPVP